MRDPACQGQVADSSISMAGMIAEIAIAGIEAKVPEVCNVLIS
jgi:hypothetical protein